MNAEQKIAKILEVINSGKTIFVCTPLRATKITKKTIAQFEKIGRPVLKAKGDSMYMTSGNGYVCIDYCRITVG